MRRLFDEIMGVERLGYYRRVGHDCFGPVVVGFVDWVAERALAKGVDKIVFAARDGYVIEKAFRLRYPDYPLPVVYLYVSRQSTLPARILENPTVEALLDNSSLKRLTSPRLLLKRYGMPEDGWRDAAASRGIDIDRAVNKSCYYRPGIYREFCQELLDAFLPTAEKKADLLCRYLRERGVEGAVALVDSGWNGSTQSSLISVGRKLGPRRFSCAGLYLMANDPSKQVRPGMEIEGYLYDAEHTRKDYVHAMASQGLVDFFCGQKCGTTLGYEEDEAGCVVPILEEYEFSAGSEFSEMSAVLDAFHEGCIDYVQNTAACKERGSGESGFKDAFNALSVLTSRPDAEAVRRIGSLLFQEGEVHFLAKPERWGAYARRPHCLLRDFSHATWKLGFLNALLHGNGFCLLLYRMLLRLK